MSSPTTFENRPPLTRWHPDWKDAFARYMEG